MEGTVLWKQAPCGKSQLIMKKTIPCFLIILIYQFNFPLVSAQAAQCKFYPEMYSYRPGTIMIMPLINRTDRKLNEGRITSEHAQWLNEKGYYVMPSNIIRYYINHDSLECLPDVNPAPCQDFYNRFGIEALLFISVKAWKKDYSESEIYEEFEYSLVSTLDGRELWFYDILVEKNTEVPKEVSDRSYAFWVNTGCGIFASVIASAIVTKFSSFNATAEEACESALRNLPAGKYGNHYLLDSLDKVSVKTIWRNQKFGNRLTIEN
jgi:hypothetical protein